MSTVFETNLSSKFAGADLTGKQYYMVKLDANDDVILCSDITDTVFGVLQNEPKDEQEAVIKTHGNTKVVASAALALDVIVGTTTGGKAQVAVSTQFPRGSIVTPAAADEDIAVISLFQDGVALS
jgi:hypothetical protein